MIYSNTATDFRSGQRRVRRSGVSQASTRCARRSRNAGSWSSTEATASIDEERFADLHRTWCAAIVRQLQNHGVAAATYGRAAKLVAVYLKGMIVVGPNAGTELACVAHPPVDRILLQNMSNATEVRSPSKRAWRHINWTQLDEGGYYRLIRELKGALVDSAPFWTLERFWTVTEE